MPNSREGDNVDIEIIGEIEIVNDPMSLELWSLEYDQMPKCSLCGLSSAECNGPSDHDDDM